MKWLAYFLHELPPSKANQQKLRWSGLCTTMSRVCAFRAALAHASSAIKGWGLMVLLFVLLMAGVAWLA